MIQEQIIEGNKLIAEFMGYKYFPKRKLNDIEGVFYKKDKCYLHADLIGKNFCAKYHSSFDWLMPVVEKISRIKIVWENSEDRTDTYYPRTFGMINEETGKIMVRFNGNTLHQADTLIEATYLAIVDFLKNYNQQSK